MGFFDKLFEKKICGICNSPIDYFKNHKLTNGYCCQNCFNELSPFFTNFANATVESIRFQINCRRENSQKLISFTPTKIMGTDFKVCVDESKRDFAVVKGGDYIDNKADIINCSDINKCDIDIVEYKKEIKYKDNNDEIHSFVPPYFGYSYDFFIEIGVTIPYINVIRFKLNSSPINNDQKDVINMGNGGIMDKFKDMLHSDRSYNGKTSNSDEVRESSKYKKYEKMANEIKECLDYYRSQQMEFNNMKDSLIRCPWCNSKIPKNTLYCEHCGGPVDK